MGTERRDGRVEYTLAEISRISNEAMLTTLEAWFLGNTPSRQGAQDPLKPLGLFREMNLKDINRLRRNQGWFASNVAGMLLGMDITRQIPLLTLAEVDQDTGSVEALPKVCGIYDKRSSQIIKDERILRKYELSEAMVRQQLEECRNSIVEKVL